MRTSDASFHYGLVTSLLTMTLVACQPAAESVDAAAIAGASAPDPALIERTPVYRSTKRLSSDCGVVRAPMPAPGMAPVAGATVADMSEPNQRRLAIGAERPMVETDSERVAPGYTVIGPTSVREKIIINNDKEIVARFEDDYFSGHVDVLDNGDRFTGSAAFADGFRAGGRNGCVERYTANGDLLWRVRISDDDYLSHHDVFLMDNGNFLAIVWERASKDEAIEQGRDPELTAENGEFWYDGIIEVDPYTLDIVWEWSARHHLIQDFDRGKRNYGIVADHPELIDINTFRRRRDEITDDWTHLNAIDYNAELDQILVSSPTLNEIWIIDHSTTPWEAMGHTGGRYGKGGDLLYRWGNAQVYDRGEASDQALFAQHDAHWIPPGLPGAGNILILNNGEDDKRDYTTVTEITAPLAADGSYVLQEGESYGPTALAWQYNPDPPERFFAWFISGVQRLSNGNTLVNQGPAGRLREVTVDGDIVWEYEYKGDHDAPYMIFRANKYPADHPGILKIIAAQQQRLPGT